MLKITVSSKNGCKYTKFLSKLLLEVNNNNNDSNDDDDDDVIIDNDKDHWYNQGSWESVGF